MRESHTVCSTGATGTANQGPSVSADISWQGQTMSVGNMIRSASWRKFNSGAH